MKRYKITLVFTRTVEGAGEDEAFEKASDLFHYNDGVDTSAADDIIMKELPND